MLQDLRLAARSLRRMGAAGAVAVLTLALGIAGATTMFGVVHATLLRPLPFADADRLAILFTTRTTPREGFQRLRWSRPAIDALRASATSFERIASFTPALVAISGRGEPEQIDAEVVSPDYFDALRVAPASGRGFAPADDTVGGVQPVVVLAAGLSTRWSGDTIRVNGVPLTIIGVMPDGFAGLSGKAQIWITPPMAARLTYAEYLTTPQNFISVVARVKDGVSMDAAHAEMTALGAAFSARRAPPGETWGAAAMPLADARVDATVRRSALVLLGAAACVLAIACVNVASLLLARARVRRREMAVRLAIGASRLRLVRQLLTEGALMAALAGLGGALLAAWFVPFFARVAPDVIATGRNYYGAVATFGRPVVNTGVLLFSLAITIATTVAFALAPAIQASRPELTGALKEDGRGGGPQGRTLATLVVVEIALACTLLAASGLLIQTFASLQSRRAGFSADGVLTFWVRPPTSRYTYPDDGPAFIERLLAHVEAVPGVESAAINRCTPFGGCSRSVIFFADRPSDPANAPGIGRHYVSAGYFETLGIPLRSGRLLTPADRAGSPPVAVVNEAGARRFWPGENPIGKRVWFGTTTGPFADPSHAVEIVGVVGDVPYEGAEPSDRARADFYTSYLQFAYPDTMVMVRTRGAAAALVPALRRAVADVDASLPIYDVLALDDRIDAAIARPRFNAALLAAFAGIALLLAAIGVYGVLSYSVATRLREIGVRLALGASANGVVWLVLGRGLRLASIGAAVGVAGALAGGRLLRGLIGSVSPTDPIVVGGAALVMIATAAAAAFVPARRASAVDPIVVLRNE